MSTVQVKFNASSTVGAMTISGLNGVLTQKFPDYINVDNDGNPLVKTYEMSSGDLLTCIAQVNDSGSSVPISCEVWVDGVQIGSGFSQYGTGQYYKSIAMIQYRAA